MIDIIQILKIPVIETERLILRELSLEDTDNVFEYASIPEVTAFLLWHPNQSRHDSINFINFAKDLFEKKISIIFCIELKEDKKIVGIFDIRITELINNCCEIGYVLVNKYWNRGIIPEGLRSIIKYGFNELKINRIEAKCDSEDIGSSQILEKAGMQYEGTMREKVYVKDKYRSMKMYSILKREYID